MALKGVIDLGSNSVRLVIYDVKHKAIAEWKDAGAPTDKQHRLFRDVVSEKKVAGLSAYVEKNNLTHNGIEVAIDVLSGHLIAAENVGCHDVSVFATAFLRNCKNSDAAIKKISRAIGQKIDLLSDEAEAHLGFIGASCNREIEEGTLIDIGGGSTELTSIEGAKDRLNLSLPQGSVSSYAEFVKMILPTEKEASKIRAAFEKQLLHIKDLKDFKTKHLYGIGGSVRAVKKLYTAAFASEVHSDVLAKHQISMLYDLLLESPSEFAHTASKAIPERLHSIVPGLVILLKLMDILDASDLAVCKYGVREGYLLERILKLKR